MAVESYLAVPFDYRNYVVTDETDLLTKLEARLLAAGWTNTSGHIWKSVDPTRFIILSFSLPGSGKIRCVATDYNGHSLTERLFTVAASDGYDIFISPYSLIVSGPTTLKWFKI